MILGAGPNGLAAGVTLARAGLTVAIVDENEGPGGSARTIHWPDGQCLVDVGSAVHPMAVLSPFFSCFDLEKRIGFVYPEISFASIVGSGRPSFIYPSSRLSTGSSIGHGDGLRRLIDFVGEDGAKVVKAVLRFPRMEGFSDFYHLLRFGTAALFMSTPLRRIFFKQGEDELFRSVEDHLGRNSSRLARAAVGLNLLTAAYAKGWPIPIGGAQAISDSLAQDFSAHGGVFFWETKVESISSLPRARAIILTVSNQQLTGILRRKNPASRAHIGDRLDPVMKHDFLLSQKIDWKESELGAASVVHIDDQDHQILVSEPTRFDGMRGDKSVVWAYERGPRVVHGASGELAKVLDQYASGFSESVITHRVIPPNRLQEKNSNLWGGDITAGPLRLSRLLNWTGATGNPWTIKKGEIYNGSASTPPGPGVHGMSGYNAARAVLKDCFNMNVPPKLGLGPSS